MFNNFSEMTGPLFKYKFDKGMDVENLITNSILLKKKKPEKKFFGSIFNNVANDKIVSRLKSTLEITNNTINEELRENISEASIIKYKESRMSMVPLKDEASNNIQSLNNGEPISTKKLNEFGVIEYQPKKILNVSEFFEDFSDREHCQTINDYLSAISDIETKSLKPKFKTNNLYKKKVMNINPKACRSEKIKSRDDFFILSKKDEKFKLKNHTCQICNGELSVIDKYSIMKRCNHVVHQKCMKKKLKKFDFVINSGLKIKSNECPICRHCKKVPDKFGFKIIKNN